MIENNSKPKFAIGYNGTSVREFKAIYDVFEKEIDSIYFSVPKLVNSHHKMPLCNNYNNNVINFLKTNFSCKRFLALNNVATKPFDENDDKFIKESLVPFINEYNIEGIIVADFRMAMAIRHYLPNILIDSSCNSYIFTLREANMWNDYIGIHNINPPREVLRQPKLLDELAGKGLRLKCIVNESCLIGCPTSHRHNLFIASQFETAKMKNETTESGKVICTCGDDANFFRSNWILPRWLNHFDDKVSIYKLSTRPMNNYQLYKTLKAYTNREEVDNIFDIIIDGTAEYIKNKYKNIKINSCDIPDKLLSCGCVHCNKECDICANLAKKFIKGDINE